MKKKKLAKTLHMKKPKREKRGRENYKNEPQPAVKKTIRKRRPFSVKHFSRRQITAYTVLMVIIIGVLLLNLAAPTGIIEWVKVGMASGGKGGDFPTLYSGGGTVKDMSVSANEILILDEIMLTSYNKKGDKIYSRLHGFFNPQITVSSIRSMVFDRAGTNFRIENASRTVFASKLDNTIIDADICDNGTYAFITDSKKYAAEVHVYSPKNRQIFKWNSSEIITAVSLSANGKKVVFAAAEIKNGNIMSTIYAFDTGKEKPEYTKRLEDQTVLRLEHDKNKNILCLTDKNVLIMQSDMKKKTEYEYSRTERKTFDTNPTNGAVFVFGNTVVSFGTDGKKDAEFIVEKPIIGVSREKNKIFILSDKLYSYDLKGKLTKTTDAGENPLFVKGIGKDAVILTREKLILIKSQ